MRGRDERMREGIQKDEKEMGGWQREEEDV